MLPDSPSPRAALALSDLQPQTGASTFSIGSGSGNWSTRGVGGVSGDYMDKSGGGGMFGNSRNNVSETEKESRRVRKFRSFNDV
ncbi:hypothetical protein CAEBREN_14286 [Caenorhabditis brenneri]|uniref:Uncharacterized protein n=1 Tax=Caenorhabditis brenneri TaxID=135651 RepID=G0NV78_CAEBE|nr:hypothetical protein CAEBREN_14286 [Caenorhabditis brenneri]